MKKNLFYAVGLLGTLLVTGCNTQANVAQTQAKEIALRNVGLQENSDLLITATKADNYTDENQTFKVEIFVDNIKYVYIINITTSSIEKITINDVNVDINSQPSSPYDKNNNSYIGIDKAQEIAFTDANCQLEQLSKLETEFDFDDGKYLYEVEFEYNFTKYEYDIDAITGNIYQKDVNDITYIFNGANVLDVDKIKEIVLNKVNIVDATFTQIKVDREKLALVYKVKFTADNVKYRFVVNATTGEIIEMKKENDTKQDQTSLISLDEAKEIALSHASLKASDVIFTKSKLDKDDGVYVYEIEFKYNKMEYEYKIDAKTGKVIEVEIEED